MCDSLTGHFDSAVRVKHKGQKVRDRMKRPGYEEGVWEDNRRKESHDPLVQRLPRPTVLKQTWKEGKVNSRIFTGGSYSLQMKC